VKVGRHVEIAGRIGELKGKIGTAFVIFYEHHKFAEDFAEVTPVDFIDDEKVGSVGVLAGFLAKVKEGPVFEFKASFAIGTVSLDEILIGIGLVKLDHGSADHAFFYNGSTWAKV
jgi:hypothetical protein